MIGTQTLYSSFICTVSLGLFRTFSIEFELRKNAARHFLAEQLNRESDFSKTPRYFHSDTNSSGELLSVIGEQVKESNFFEIH